MNEVVERLDKAMLLLGIGACFQTMRIPVWAIQTLRRLLIEHQEQLTQVVTDPDSPLWGFLTLWAIAAGPFALVAFSGWRASRVTWRKRPSP